MWVDPNSRWYEAAAWALGQWIEHRGGTDPTEKLQAINQVRHLLEVYADSRFEDLEGSDNRPIANRLGWCRGTGIDREFLISKEVWRAELCRGFDPRSVAVWLYEAGAILRASDSFQLVRRIDGINKRVYVLKASFLGMDEDQG